jgi:hypothetical protein
MSTYARHDGGNNATDGQPKTIGAAAVSLR